MAILKGLELRFLDHSLALTGPKRYDEISHLFWKPLESNSIKLNTDAAVRQHHSTIAIIARDEFRLVCKAWACSADTIDLEVAEAQLLDGLFSWPRQRISLRL